MARRDGRGGLGVGTRILEVRLQEAPTRSRPRANERNELLPARTGAYLLFARNFFTPDTPSTPPPTRSYDWADSYCEVKSVVSDGAGGAEITIAPTTPPVYGFLPKARFYGVNILAELDVAGEYFIDSFKEVIYWMPPPGGVSAADEVVLSVAHTLVNNSAPVAHVVFSGLHALYARGTGFSLQGLENVSLVGITSALHGHTGFSLSGYGVTLRDSTVYGTGCAAADVTGGDMMQLLPSGNFVINNSMHDYARIIRTYNPGLGWFGAVGQTMANNTFRNAPHNGMLGGGALNLVEGNLFDTLLYEATDSGAFYVGYSWTQRGNVVRGNTFRNIRATEKTMLGYPSVQAIHLDDQQSGYVLENNVCENSTTCFFVGGGRDVIVRNNICRHTGRCLHLDNRGMCVKRASAPPARAPRARRSPLRPFFTTLTPPSSLHDC